MDGRHRRHGRDLHQSHAYRRGHKTIAPTGKAYKINMATIGHWNKQGVMDEEYLFWDNQTFMKQIGLAQ